ncbi:hypothetical protein D3C75_960150 [compost metagenome]
MHRLDHTGHAWHDVGGAVLVEADFTREADGGAQFTRAGIGQLHTGSFDLGDGQVQLALFFFVAFAGLFLAVAVAVFAVVVVPGFSA